MHHGGPGGPGLGHAHQQIGHGGPHGNPHGPPGGPGGHGSMMHNMYPITAAHGGPQGIPWSGEWWPWLEAMTTSMFPLFLFQSGRIRIEDRLLMLLLFIYMLHCWFKDRVAG